MDSVNVPEEVVQYLVNQTDGSPIQREQVASLLRQRVMTATVTTAPHPEENLKEFIYVISAYYDRIGETVPKEENVQRVLRQMHPQLRDLAEGSTFTTLRELATEADGLMERAWRRWQYKPPPPPTNQVAKDLAFQPHRAVANALGPRPMSAAATVGTTTSATMSPPYHWPLHPAAVQPSYLRDRIHPAPTLPTLTQPIAYTSQPAARWQQPNTRQVHCQRCGGIGHVARQCATVPSTGARAGRMPRESVLGKHPFVDATLAGIYDSALQVAATAGRKEPLLDIRIGATTFQALVDTGSSVSPSGTTSDGGR
ncbi:hypothetical protein HPB49_024447 [Dermacentor silvarum]|uniref:Uncharacterized protein n=1 Tax=Dermacentor silvarum TaxID=543639 RepID=A0ACB8E4C6_DERSI|nr:hypothetical protein HPB49_024447 [Dermacentor silvarum]